MSEGVRDGAAGCGDRVVVERDHALRGRNRREANLGFNHDCERPLGAHDELAEIHRIFVEKRIQVVAGDTATDLRVAILNFAGVGTRYLADPTVQVAFDSRCGKGMA